MRVFCTCCLFLYPEARHLCAALYLSFSFAAANRKRRIWEVCHILRLRRSLFNQSSLVKKFLKHENTFMYMFVPQLTCSLLTAPRVIKCGGNASWSQPVTKPAHIYCRTQRGLSWGVWTLLVVFSHL